MINQIGLLHHLLRRRTLGERGGAGFRRRYRRLYEAEVERLPDGGLAFDRGRLWRRGGVNVLWVAGDPFEMAFQHGRLLADEIAGGTLRQASLLVRNAIRNNVGSDRLAWLVNAIVDRCIAEPMVRTGLDFLGEPVERCYPDLFGLTESCQIPVRTVLRVVTGPETTQVLLGLTECGGGPQCSAFAAWGAKTRDGQLLIGRNTDYPLNGYYDTHPTVIYFAPSDGAQRYMTITSAGLHIAGVCGMNESGLFVGLHTVPTCSVSERGIPALLLGQDVLQRARTLREAARLLDTIRPAAGWNFHVVSVRERQAFTYEVCHAAAAQRAGQGESHVTTNHWTQPAMLPHLMTAIRTFTADSRARAERMRQLVDAAQGQLDAAGAAAILGDTRDPASGRPRCFPGAIAATHTVSSSVWQPEARTVYVGTGGAPMSQGRFVALPTCESLDPETWGRAPVEYLDAAPRSANPPGLSEARQLVIAARIAFEYHNDAATASDLLESAAAQYHDPALDLSAALMQIRAGRFPAADKSAQRVIEQGWDRQAAAIARYLRGRLAADRGQVESARADLRDVRQDGHGDQRLVAAARACERKLEHRRRLPLHPNEIVPMGWLPDAFRYQGRL